MSTLKTSKISEKVHVGEGVEEDGTNKHKTLTQEAAVKRPVILSLQSLVMWVVRHLWVARNSLVMLLRESLVTWVMSEWATYTRH